MKNKIGDLSNYLFEQLERLQDDSLSPEELQQEIKRSQAVAKVAETIVHTGKLALDATKFATEAGLSSSTARPSLPTMLEGK